MVEKVALIGLGKIGFEYDLNRRNSKYISSHANAFTKHNNFEIVAGIDITSEKRNAFFSEYKIETYEKIKPKLEEMNVSLTKEKDKYRRILGEDPKTGHELVTYIGKFGPLVQMKDLEQDKVRFAPLGDLKMEEVINFEHAPHPVEFKMYYSS